MAHVLGHDEKTLADAGRVLGGLIGPLDPRMRILAACAFSIVVVGLSTIPALLAALGASVLLLLGARLPIACTLKRMAMMAGA